MTFFQSGFCQAEILTDLRKQPQTILAHIKKISVFQTDVFLFPIVPGQKICQLLARHLIRVNLQFQKIAL